MAQNEPTGPPSGSSFELTDRSRGDVSLQTPASTPPARDAVLASDRPPINAPRSLDQDGDNHNNIRDPLVPGARTLRARDVAALIINKMIGTGIFTGPYAVLEYTQSVRIAVGLWVLGFIYTILSMYMYLEYARKLPFTGGELVYLDHVFFPKARLFAYTLYAFYFVLVYTTCTNAMQFGVQVLLAAQLETDLNDPNNITAIDGRLVRFLAVAITTVICFLLYISNQNSRLLNRATALAKVIVLLIICGFGIAYKKKRPSMDNETIPQPNNSEGENEKRRWISAFIIVLYSFHGWENATLVAGEIHSFRVLRKGFMSAIAIVGFLYLFAVSVFCAAIDWDKDKNGPLENYTAVYFSIVENPSGGVSETARVATAIIIAVSAVGSMISVAYTGVRVKQSIGWTGILPWSWFWRRSGPVRLKSSQSGSNRYIQLVADPGGGNHLILDRGKLTDAGSPEGGIALHWIVTVIYVCIVAPRKSLQSAIGFSGNLVVYGHFFAQGFVAACFIWFEPSNDFPDSEYPNPTWLGGNPPFWMRRGGGEGSASLLHWMKDGIGQIILGTLVLAFSLAVVFSDIAEKQNWQDMVIIVVILAVAAVYWLLFVRGALASRLYGWFGYELLPGTHGVDYQADPSRQCIWCEELRTEHRHPIDSYQQFNRVKAKDNETGLLTKITYTIFGDRTDRKLLLRPWSKFKLPSRSATEGN